MRTLRTFAPGAGLAALLFAVLPAVAQAPGGFEPATLVVRLPAEDARLTVDGTPTRQTGLARRFLSPPLKPGRRYAYTLTAVWEPNNYTRITRSREVAVWAGRESEADLRTADPKRPDSIVIRYVPTPPDVVDAMLKLAKVGKDDVVFDLGCGDGRIVVAAVEKFHARRGVGVDLDQERVRESEANARRTGVEDRVEFRRGDVFAVKDLGKATVVTLYMGEESNRQLRPTLEKLRPGTRVVSHRFTIGDWKPDRSETITGADGEDYRIHLWTVREK